MRVDCTNCFVLVVLNLVSVADQGNRREIIQANGTMFFPLIPVKESQDGGFIEPQRIVGLIARLTIHYPRFNQLHQGVRIHRFIHIIVRFFIAVSPVLSDLYFGPGLKGPGAGKARFDSSAEYSPDRSETLDNTAYRAFPVK